MWHLTNNVLLRAPSDRSQRSDASLPCIISCRAGIWQRPQWALCLSWKLWPRARVTEGCVYVPWRALTCCERASDSATLNGSTSSDLILLFPGCICLVCMHVCGPVMVFVKTSFKFFMRLWKEHNFKTILNSSSTNPCPIHQAHV